jgi:hypothetical protein
MHRADADALRTIERAYIDRLATMGGHDGDDFTRQVWATVRVWRALEGKKFEPGTRNVRKTENVLARKTGAIFCADAIKGPITSGFTSLLNHGRPDLTAEGLALLHPHLFNSGIVDRARRGLAENGVDCQALVAARAAKR